ncbi:MAG: putative peptidase M15 [Prokaryotic dsDNA virus sp.]|nr:MAG: putative peptidase M15 [Prokaryotic dsDNA virus sp.]
MTIVSQVSVSVKINVRVSLKYFSYEEFASPDVPHSGEYMDADFLSMLDSAREISGIPFKINSGYRTIEHNYDVGGKPNSSHIVGKAADIAVKGSRQRWVITQALIQAGFNRIGIAKTFIHVDSDDTKDPDVIWTY